MNRAFVPALFAIAGLLAVAVTQAFLKAPAKFNDLMLAFLASR